MMWVQVLALSASMLASEGPPDPGSVPTGQAVVPGETLGRITQRVHAYFDGLFSISCTETVKQQRLKEDLFPGGDADEFVYDYLVLRQQAEGGALQAATAWREAKLINRKPAGPKERSRLADPSSVYIEPLSFLLPANIGNYEFTFEGETEWQGRRAVAITFSPRNPGSPNVKWEGRRFVVSGIAKKGRLVVDPENWDVLELKTELAMPFEFKQPAVRWHGPLFTIGPNAKLKLERSDTTIRFRPVAFRDPDQVLLLPESAETVTVIRGAGIPIFRTTQQYSAFKRFLTQVKIRGLTTTND